jgi:pyruvate/2-oxoglutarate dehydrogenase complex dihydrolipoamide dehydrogenase (E3) component
LTYESVFDLTECPKRLLVIGGGPVGCELAQAFARLGSRVTLVQDEPMFLGHEERDAAQLLSDALARDGIEIHLDTQTTMVHVEGNDTIVDLVNDRHDAHYSVDRISWASARAPNVRASGSKPRASLTTARRDPVDDFLRTTNRAHFRRRRRLLGTSFRTSRRRGAHSSSERALFWGRERLGAHKPSRGAVHGP